MRDAYESYAFHVVYHEILNFCTVELSKIYIDVTKDRVYTEKKNSRARRAAQSVMYTVLDGMIRLLAPILAFTADEVWQMMPHKKTDDPTHVLLNDLPVYDASYVFAEEAKYDKLFAMRDDVMKALENARAEKLIGKSLEAKITLYTGDDREYELLSSFGRELNELFIVSDTEVLKGEAPDGVEKGESGVAVCVSVAEGCKCDRCWTVVKKGQKTADGGFLCLRCLANIQ